MSISHTYVKELESLILNTLLPSYISYQHSIGNKNPLASINQSLLSQIRAKRELPALLRPY